MELTQPKIQFPHQIPDLKISICQHFAIKALKMTQFQNDHD